LPEDAVRGVFITFEGVEVAGKTTQITRLAQHLVRRGHSVEQTAEPGGTGLGRVIRRLLERPDLAPDPITEAFLFMADRRQHVTECIGPALRRGRIVLCDRYTDATVAYQGYGRGVDPDLLRELNLHATGGLQPDLTLLFDLDPREGFRRIGARQLDRFEREKLAFHRRVRRGYLEILKAEPKRVRIVRAARAPAVIAAEVALLVDELLGAA
jgi:dTMP kinase